VTRLPAVIAHADWSTDANKRWLSVALESAGGYCIHAARPVGNAFRLIDWLIEFSDDGPIVLGFDFPIGLPEVYARRAGIQSFRTELPKFGEGKWKNFFKVARVAGEVALARPFYPYAPGGTSQSHLIEALGLTERGDLLRRCDRATPDRSAAGALFWMLGAKQSGRAAIAGWQEVVRPALAEPKLNAALWPFDGPMDVLLSRHRVVMCETYPANGYVSLSLPRHGWSKRRQGDRRAHAASFTDWAKARGAVLDAGLLAQIADGFGDKSTGEDAFDATAGMVSMIDALASSERGTAPDIPAVTHIEGWIFGQPAYLNNSITPADSARQA
jgi:hypothetical protein